MTKPLHRPLSDWTFKQDDKLELTKFADDLQRYLEVDHHFVTGSLVVGLDAPFGSGKSSFLSMWANLLREKHETDPTSPLPILINAWEDDFCGEPLLSLVASFSKALEDEEGTSATIGKRIRKAARQVFWFGVGLANSIVRAKTGADPVAAGKLAQEKTEDQSTEPNADLFSLFHCRQDALRSLKQELASAIESESVNMFVIVDELDRCRPDYAITFLETLKHIFDIHGLIVVLAIDRGQIENSARALFGQGLNADEYLRKFISRSFKLPTLRESQVENFLPSLLEKFAALEQVRRTSIRDQIQEQRLARLITALGLKMRQIEELFRVVGHVFSNSEDTDRELGTATIHAVLFLYAVKLWDSQMYQKITHAGMEIQELCKWLVGLELSNTDREFWGTLCYVGGLRRPREQSLSMTMSKFGIVSSPSNQAQSALEDRIGREWGFPEKNYLMAMYQLIEEASTLFR